MDLNKENVNHGNPGNSYDLNSKIMITAILSLSFVIILVVILHIYARCVLRHPPLRRQRTAPSATVFLHQLQPTAEPVPAKSGLDPMVINSLPSFLFKQSKNQEHDQIECAVCLSFLEEDELARQLPNCNHVFHIECVDRWLSEQSTCPICRSEAAPRLAPHDREPPIGTGQLEVVAIIGDHEHEDQCDTQGNVHDSSGNSNATTKVINGSGPSSSSFRLSSFRKMLGRDRSTSSSSRRIQICGDLDLERQGLP